MVQVIYLLFICLVIPLTLMLFLLQKDARLTVGFMIIGIFCCLFASEVNAVMLELCGRGMYFTTTTITPLTEEIIKALPIVFFGFVICDDREKLLSVSMAVGIGFALLEDSYIMVQSASTVSLTWIAMRGLSAGLMHGLCTAFVGFGTSFVRKKKKLFFTGTFGLLSVAVLYHALYNTLVQSEYSYVGLFLPLLTYIPIVIVLIRKRISSKNET